MLQKMCRVCEYVKPVTDFTVDCMMTDGYKNQCKPCRSAYGKKYYHQNKERFLENKRKSRLKKAQENEKNSMNKLCIICDYVKTTDQFPKSMVTHDGYFEMCKPCFNDLVANRPPKDLVPNDMHPGDNYLADNPPTSTAPTPPKPKRKSPSRFRTPEQRLEDQRDYSLGHLYGLTREGYNKIKEAQGNVCAICKLPPKSDNSYGKLVIDYDAPTDTVRGIVCRKCKLAFINLDSNIDRLYSVIEYLEKAKK